MFIYCSKFQSWINSTNSFRYSKGKVPHVWAAVADYSIWNILHNKSQAGSCLLSTTHKYRHFNMDKKKTDGILQSNLALVSHKSKGGWLSIKRYKASTSHHMKCKFLILIHQIAVPSPTSISLITSCSSGSSREKSIKVCLAECWFQVCRVPVHIRRDLHIDFSNVH